MSFKQPGASPNGGRLAKAVINLHRPYQVSTTISSLNTVFCINGYVGDVPTKFLLDSGAAISVINSDIVRDKPLNQVNICAVGANGTPLEVAGQTTVTIHLSDFKVDHQFTVVHNLTVDCLLGADFLQHHGAVLIIRCLWERNAKQSFLWTSNDNPLRIAVPSLLMYVHHVTWKFLEEQLCFLTQCYHRPAMPFQ